MTAEVEKGKAATLPRGLRLALRNLRIELGAWRLHRRGARKARAYAARTGLKLHVGCGPNYKPGWVNIDLTGNADLSLDMREPIPLSTGSASFVYSEHFFEHLDYPGDACRFLAEAYRLLEPGGIFSVGVPDTRWPLLDYAGKGDGKYIETCEAEHWHPGWAKTFIDHINYHFRQDGTHLYAYDFETLRRALEGVGFMNVRERLFDPVLDSAHRRVGTLYVDAAKPR
jgi:predicted SAM-dependent methyltransferase